MGIVELALEIATSAHKGQVDKAGKDYINHPMTVASYVNTDEEKATALLHDVIEDTEYTADKLITLGIPTNVVEAVKVLTKNKGTDYMDYLSLVKANPIARAVKLADLKHNMQIERIPNPTDKDYKRIEKYKKAKEFLENI